MTTANPTHTDAIGHSGIPHARRGTRGLFDTEMLWPALRQAFVMLRPDIQWTNPVMFVVEVGALLTLLFVIQALVSGSSSQVPVTYFIALDASLFLTVVFANFATAVAEARGRAQAESLRKTRQDTPARRLRSGVAGAFDRVSSSALAAGDLVVVSAGEVIPGDGEVMRGTA